MKSLSIILLACLSGTAQVSSVSIAHYDTNRTGWNSSENVLTPSNVTTGKFGLLGTYTVDGNVYAQALYQHNVTISGKQYDVIFQPTMHCSVYAFDANVPGKQLWKTSLCTSRTTYPAVSTDGWLYHAEASCAATPALGSGYLYVECVNSTPTHILYKIDITTGTVALSVTVTGQVTGTGDPTGGDTTSGGNVVFYPDFEFARPGLILSPDGSKVYICYGGWADTHPWHGWIFAYNTADLSQAAVWCASPNTYGAAIWQSGAAPAMDASGNLYVTTGNDSYDGITAFGESVVKLSPTLTVLDWFTPSNYSTLDTDDADVSTNGPLLIPGDHYVIANGKAPSAFVIDTNCMGHVQGSNGNCALQTFTSEPGATITGNSGSRYLLWFNNTLYVSNMDGTLYGYAYLGSGTFNTTATLSLTATGWAKMGPILDGSSNGTSNPIMWIVTAASSYQNSAQAGVLRALNPATGSEYWNSGSSLGNVAKFVSPTNANGRVYVPTQSGYVAVYGLLSSSSVSGQVTVNGQSTLH